MDDDEKERLKVSVMVYNIWMMPPVITGLLQPFLDISIRKNTRAAMIAKQIPDDVDIVVLAEAFCHKALSILQDGLRKRGFIYSSGKLGTTQNQSCCHCCCSFTFSCKLLDGGIVVLSKHPIEEIEECFFGSASAGDDALANKGVMYAKILMNSKQPVHMFASHTQAWDTPKCKAARKQQFRIIHDFIQLRNIPTQEPVIIAGDLNVDRFGENIQHKEDGHYGASEYYDMLEILQAKDFHDIREGEHSIKELVQQVVDASSSSEKKDPKLVYSFDHIKNKLATSGPSSSGTSGLLDYILFSTNHRLPSEGYIDVLRIISDEQYLWKGVSHQDLSDHYPVRGRFYF